MNATAPTPAEPTSAELDAIVTELVQRHADALGGEPTALARMSPALRQLIEWAQAHGRRTVLDTELERVGPGRYTWPRGATRQPAAAGATDPVPGA